MRNLFTIIHFFFFVYALHSQIIFESNFDSGNLETVTTTDSINFVVTSRADIVGRWFYFKMKNVNGKYVSVRVSNSDVVRPMYSYDDVNWTRFSQSECPSKNVFQKTYTSDSVYVAYYIPFSFLALQKKLQEWRERPFVRVDTIGYSEQNRPLQLLTIKDFTFADSLKFNIWIHGRTHPSETPSSFHLNGMIEFLLSDEEIAQYLRERINFFILPFINPDGVYLGKSRVNANNLDLERQWNLPDSSTPKEVISAKKFLASILSKKNISVALNMHSQAADFATLWVHTASSTSNYFYRREMQFSNLQSANTPYLAQSDFSYSNLQSYFPEGWFWANWGDSIMALTYETPYTKFSNNVWLDNSILSELGKQTVWGIMEYLGINHPKRFILDNANAFVVGNWLRSTLYTNFYGSDYLQITPSFLDYYVEWQSNLLSKGKYYVYAWWQDLPNCATNANYQIFADGMNWNKIVNQQTNGGKWVLLDSVILNSSSNISIKLTNQGDGTIIADAIKIVYAGLPTKLEREMFANDFQLYQNFPNPFNQSTIIRFFINNKVSDKSIISQIVSIKIYDILGKELLTLNEEPKSAGVYEVEFSGKDKFGNPLSSGIYFCTMQVGNRTKTIKMSLVK